jgi:16S rRNA (guanine966-N2)-methyltransferase
VRVIAGERKGLRLLAPRSKSLRPTSDRVKRVLFDVLRDEVRGVRVLDLYAGTGALGIEALSRGAHEAIFVERNAGALAALRRNLDAARYWDRARVVAQSVRQFIRRWPETEEVGLIVADPPYGDEAGRVLLLIDRFAGLKSGGVAVVEHSRREELNVSLTTLLRWDHRFVGDTSLSLFRREAQ